MGIYPRRDREERIAVLNTKIRAMAQSVKVQYFDIGTTLLLDTQKINEKLFSDGLHPNTEGYEVLGKLLADILKK